MKRMIAVIIAVLMSATIFVGCRQNNDVDPTVTKEQAQSIALADAGLTADQVTRLYIHFDRDNGSVYYDMSFYYDNTEYEYDIDAVTGNILDKDLDRDNTL